MREKKRTLIVSFETTTQAIAMEMECKKAGLPGRMIPLPEQVSAGCGLSWSAPPEYKERLLTFLKEKKLMYDQFCEIYF